MSGTDGEGPAPSLRFAGPSDREVVFHWLVASEATPAMMGPPDFSDAPVPSREEFLADYVERYFTPEGDGYERLFMISVGGRDVGCISYGGLEEWRGVAELDIWIGSSADWGHGWGSWAVRELSNRLLEHPGVDFVVIRPSARNRRAVAAYRKAGFAECRPGSAVVPEWVFTQDRDYMDAVVLVRTRS